MKDEPADHEPDILDPGRIKALSHPLRRRILHRLRAHGPATSTTIGEALGANTGTTSYHLRHLEKHGFIEEIPERSAGRERWWRAGAGARDVRLPDPATLAPEDRPVLGELVRARHAEDMEVFARLPDAFEREAAWARLSRGFAFMTEEGLHEFFEAYVRLLHEHAMTAEDAAPGARPLHIRLFAVPADEQGQDTRRRTQ